MDEDFVTLVKALLRIFWNGIEEAETAWQDF